MGSMSGQCEPRANEQRIGEAQRGGKSQQGRHKQKSFPKAKRIYADEDHSEYGYCSSGCAKKRLTQSDAGLKISRSASRSHLGKGAILPSDKAARKTEFNSQDRPD